MKRKENKAERKMRREIKQGEKQGLLKELDVALTI